MWKLWTDFCEWNPWKLFNNGNGKERLPQVKLQHKIVYIVLIRSNKIVLTKRVAHVLSKQMFLKSLQNS